MGVPVFAEKRQKLGLPPALDERDVAAVQPVQHLLLKRGWLHTTDNLHAVHTGEAVMEDTQLGEAEGPICFTHEAPVYTDGSCVKPADSVLARAAYAVWQEVDGQQRYLIIFCLLFQFQ